VEFLVLPTIQVRVEFWLHEAYPCYIYLYCSLAIDAGIKLVVTKHDITAVFEPPIAQVTMASGDNYFTHFLESQQNFLNWPINLLSTGQFEHDLESYQETLAAANTDLFHRRSRSVYLLDYAQSSKC
jgi:hypothetical protein